MRAYPRADRIKIRIQEIISRHLIRHTKDPRLELVTITSVDLSRDLRVANVYFTTAGGEKAQSEAIRGFISARGYLKKSCAKELGLRYMPDLRFHHDESFDYGAKINRLLKDIEEPAAEDTDDTDDTNNS